MTSLAWDITFSKFNVGDLDSIFLLESDIELI
jgi:hypothetical protein